MPREIAGNTAGAGIKFPTVPRDGFLIGESPAVAVGRIASRPAGENTYRYVTLVHLMTSSNLESRLRVLNF